MLLKGHVQKLHYSQEGWNSKTQALGTKSEEMGGLGSWKEELKRQLGSYIFGGISGQCVVSILWKAQMGKK